MINPHIDKEGSLMFNPILTSEEFATGDVTCVRLTLHYQGAAMTREAVAKRDPGDANDPETGLLLAHGRALRKLGNSFIEHANQRVREADKKRRQEQAKQAQERAKQRKVQNKVEAEKSATEAVAELRQELRFAVELQNGLGREVDKLHIRLKDLQDENAALREKNEAYRKADYARRIETRRANAAKAVYSGKPVAKV